MEVIEAVKGFQFAVQKLLADNPPQKRNSTISNYASKLRSRGDIVFRPADKNLGLVALDTIHYNKLIVDQLTDTTTYKLFEGNIDDLKSLLTPNITQLIRDLTLNGNLDKQQSFTINTVNWILPAFHGLPKLHKNGDLKLRPIVGATNWLTTNPSKLLSHFLQRESASSPLHTILRDSKSLASNLDDLKLPKNAIIFTMDATSLYTNMTVDLTLSSLVEFLQLRPNPQLQTILPLLAEFVLNNNYFEYNNRIYKQTQGIAMGTNAAVHLANIYVFYHFDRYFETHPKMLFYKRYIDDVFGIWSGTEDELRRHIEWGNNLTTSLKWNPEFGSTVNFLDLKISNSNGILSYATHQKDMNTYSYIPPFSNHPRSVFKGFIKGELIRYLRTNSEASGYFKMKALFRIRLNRRGFANRFLDPIFSSVLWIDRSKALALKAIDDTMPLVKCLTIPFSKRPVLGSIQKILKQKERDMIARKPARILLTYSKTPNIFDLVCRSRLTAEQCEFLSNQSKIDQAALQTAPP